MLDLQGSQSTVLVRMNVTAHRHSVSIQNVSDRLHGCAFQMQIDRLVAFIHSALFGLLHGCRYFCQFGMFIHCHPHLSILDLFLIRQMVPFSLPRFAKNIDSTYIDEIVKEKDVEVEWMPFELRPVSYPKIDPWQEPDKLSSWEAFILPTAEKFGVEMRLPRVSPHPYTHLAFEGYQFAREHGKGNEFHHRVFTAFFQEEQNIEDIEVLTELSPYNCVKS